MEGRGGLGWGASVSVENAFIWVDVSETVVWTLGPRRKSMNDENGRVEPFPVREECSRSRVTLKERTSPKKHSLRLEACPSNRASRFAFPAT